MRIGIDASRLRTGMSGIGRYIYSILEPLDAVLPEATFILYVRGDFDGVLPSNRWQIRQDGHLLWRRMPTLYWTRFRLAKLAKADRLDVFWAANTLLPMRMKSVPCVATFYDLNHVLAPETMTLLTRIAYKLWFSQAVKQAAFIVAISQGTSLRLKSSMGRSADAIARPAIPLSVVMLSNQEAEQLICKIGVQRPYLLTVGSFEPRKNLGALIAAVAGLKSRGKLASHQLVMVGAKGWGRALDATPHLDSQWLLVPGYIDDKSLAALYTLADVFVFPSIYEGYGIPVSEAVAYGCRVVATEMPELREAGGEDVIYVEPSVRGLEDGIELALAMSKPLPRLPAHGWAEAAKTMADALRLIAKSTG
jgi:glycosyltransferase involved in cell wall biosynthesis